MWLREASIFETIYNFQYNVVEFYKLVSRYIIKEAMWNTSVIFLLAMVIVRLIAPHVSV